MAKETLDGMLAFHIEVKIDPHEMKKWSPERIKSFFDGLAKIVAVTDAPVVLSRPSSSPPAEREITNG